MRLWSLLKHAVLGWRAIVIGDPDWGQHFRANPAGMVTALIILLLVALAVTLVGTIGASMSELALVLAVLVELCGVAGLVLATLAIRLESRSQVPALTVIVPGIYALVPYVVVRTALAIFVAPLVVLALVGLAFLLYRLGRVAGQWSASAAAAFVVLSIALLVTLPTTLYMLANPPVSPI